MLFALLLIFVVVPVVEISILIEVGEQIGALTTVSLVILTAAVGAALVRSQGLQTLMNAQQKLQRGEQPGQEIIEGVMLAIAGVLLITPGFATDFLGLLVLMPLTRKPIASYLLGKLIVRGMNGAQFGGQGFQQHPQQSDDAIDGEFVEKGQPQLDPLSTRDNDDKSPK